MRRRVRVYPTSCTSAFCGKIDCTGCSTKPVLDEFKQWVEDNDAVVSDPIWCPTVYVAKCENNR